MSLGDYGPRGQSIFGLIMFTVISYVVYADYGGQAIALPVLGLMGIAYQVGRVVERDYIEEHKWDPDSRVWRQEGPPN